MVLGISEDYSCDVVLDAELTALPSSGLYLNSGVHPSITLNNLLEFLPFNDVTITAWSNATTYSKYIDTRKRSDIVSYQNKIYQSKVTSNTNHLPTDTSYWLETNQESLKLKSHIFKVIDKVYNDLNLNKRLINNQYIYEVGKNTVTLPNNYASWVFEPKGSDYVTITINQISLQKTGTTPIDLYVINQGVLIDTLEITPSNGIVEFKDVNYTFKGKGEFRFVIDAADVIIDNSVIQPLKYDGFVCYTETGIGDNPTTANWSKSFIGNGLGFNVSCYLDAKTYIDNNLHLFGNFIRSVFELMTLEMFLHNSENRINRTKGIQQNVQLLLTETKSLDGQTVVRNYKDQLSIAKSAINKTFDTQLMPEDDSSGIELTSV